MVHIHSLLFSCFSTVLLRARIIFSDFRIAFPVLNSFGLAKWASRRLNFPVVKRFLTFRLFSTFLYGVSQFQKCLKLQSFNGIRLEIWLSGRFKNSLMSQICWNFQIALRFFNLLLFLFFPVNFYSGEKTGVVIASQTCKTNFKFKQN